MEQQNIEKRNSRNDTFIQREQSSLASSRGKPPAKQRYITIILKTNTSHASYSYLYQFYILKNLLVDDLSRSESFY
jgi:hypothetical protein